MVVTTRSLAASRILFIGTGKLSRHLNFYLSGLGFKTHVQSSREPLTTATQEFRPDAVYVLVKDDAIEATFQRYRSEFPREVVWLHASGSLSVAGMMGLHPLCTFGQTLYAPKFYQTVPIIYASDEGFDPRALFSSLPNPLHAIQSTDRPLYHALCAISGNFPALLWREVFERFENELGLSREALRPLIEQSMKNAFDSEAHLTGPIARQDRGTIDRHLKILGTHRLRGLYSAFLDTFLGDSKK